MGNPRAAIAMTVAAAALFATGGTAQALGPSGTTPGTVAMLLGIVVRGESPAGADAIRKAWSLCAHCGEF